MGNFDAVWGILCNSFYMNVLVCFRRACRRSSTARLWDCLVAEPDTRLPFAPACVDAVILYTQRVFEEDMRRLANGWGVQVV